MADSASLQALPSRDASTESSTEALQQTLDEARMVLPGVQALFGFQLIAVFSDGFERRLGGWSAPPCCAAQARRHRR